MQLKPLLFIFLGGGLGASLRYMLSTWLNFRNEHVAGQCFPWGIFSCNLIGCLLIGLVFGWLKAEHPHWIHPLFVTGLLGGFTTFSSFALDTHLLIQNQAYITAITYSVGSLLLGIALCLIGFTLTN